MTVTKTIELSNTDQGTLQDALLLIDKISRASGKPLVEVFDYFLYNAEFDDNMTSCEIDKWIAIDDI